ncbi:hypothetical protein CY35_12G094300 [Sphagnum magellanicum]|nr:hypothetical protein CY35_12G094300 [Sphagnum magellanicum]
MTMKSQCTEARNSRSSNSSAATAAMAIAGRSSRACDVCGVQRAHWYCAADEAFLCENCDGGVHNANAVALRHERVRLAPNVTPTAKLPRHSSTSQCHLSKASSKRSRSSRPHTHDRDPLSKLCKTSKNSERVHDGQKLDLKVELVDQFCELSDEPVEELSQGSLRLEEGKQSVVPDFFQDCLGSGVDIDCTVSLIIGNSSSSAGFLGCDIPRLVIDEAFDAFDVDYGLNFDVAIGGAGSVDALDAGNHGRDEDAEGRGCLNSTTSSLGCGSSFSSRVDRRQQSWPDLERIDTARIFASTPKKEEDVTKQQLLQRPEKMKKDAEEILKCSLEDLRHVPSLRLDYEDVLNAWSDRGALWTDAKLNPQTVPSEEFFNSDAPNPDSTDLCIVPDIFMSLQQQEQPDVDSVRGTGEDGCLWTNEAAAPREARVLRYKEKRRTRLFSKKIRYHVRKFNAERRPRMKGRFVKRMHLSS